MQEIGYAQHFDLQEAVNMAYYCYYHNPIHNEHPPENVDMAYIALVASYMVESRDSYPLPIVLPSAAVARYHAREQMYRDVADLAAAWKNSELDFGVSDPAFVNSGDVQSYNANLTSGTKDAVGGYSRNSYNTESGTTLSLGEDHTLHGGASIHSDGSHSANQAACDVLAQQYYQYAYYSTPGRTQDSKTSFSQQTIYHDIDRLIQMCSTDSGTGQFSIDQKRTPDDLAHNHAKRDKMSWTPAEIEFLNSCKQNHPRWNYGRIAHEMNQWLNTSRSAKQIQQRWCRIQNPEINRGRWTSFEDEKLAQLYVIENGSIRLIIKHLKTRTAVQVRQRLIDLKIIPAHE